jgi:CelD/BcsL family acetyltransferase involved in cellulose biosynthesis
MSPGLTAAWSITGPSHQTPLQTTGLSVEWSRNLDLSQDDAASLEALIDSRPESGVFISRAWLSGFFDEPPDGFEPSLLAFREEGILRGVIPLATRSTFSHTRVTLLGGGAGSDRTDLLACRGYEAACADAFLSWLASSFGPRGFILQLRDVPAESPIWSAVHRAMRDRGTRLVGQPHELHALPHLDLRERYSGNPAFARESHSLQKHRRWLERRGVLRIDLLDDEAEVLSAFDSLVRFLHVRWQAPGNHGSALDDVRMERFHRHVLPRLLAEGRLRMLRLSSDMRTIAVFYGIGTSRWWGYYLAGYDREWAGRIHLGRLTIAAAIDVAAERGIDTFDFLKGAEPVKYLWPVRDSITVDADIYSASSGAQFTRAMQATRQAAAAFAKSARNIPATYL